MFLVVLFGMGLLARTFPQALCQYLEELRGPVLFAEPPSRIDFSNNTGTTLKCTAKGVPAPRLEWVYSDDSPVKNVPGLRRIYSNGTLVINSFPAEKFRQDIHTTVYKCLASNIVGVVSSRSIHVRTVVTQSYEIQVYDEFVIAGNTAVFKCNLPSFVLDYVFVTTWLRDTGSHIDASYDFDDKYKVMPTGELHIRYVTTDDASTSYRCRTINKMTGNVRTSTSSGRLFVTEPPGSVPPRFHHIKLNIRVRRGDNVTLPCTAQGYPVPSYSWYKKSEDGKHSPFLVLGKYRQDVDSLKIEQVRESDHGIYVCVVNNTVGSERGETSLFVWEPLSAQIQPRHQVANVGQVVRFRCIYGGFPVLSIVWLKDAKPISQSHDLMVTHDVLQINSVKKESRGMYQCLVTNDDESVQAEAELRLGDLPPEIHHTFMDISVQPGRNLSLKCTASGIPLPQITWKLDDMDITKSALMSVGSYVDDHGDRASYVNVTSLSSAESGEYSCMAENRVNKMSHVARVNVYGPPFVRIMGRKNAVAGRDLVIKCPYGGYPIESIIWEKDGTRLPVDHRQVAFRNGTLMIRDVQRTQDAGRYRCVVSNAEGRSASRELEVIVLVPPTVVPFSFQEGQLHMGMRAQVFCAVSEGDLPLTMEWLKDGYPLTSPSSSVDVVVRRIDDYTSSLIITVLSSRHNGNYTCVAANSAATSNHSALLYVNVPPKWITVPSDREILGGHHALVDCVVDGAPKPKITWMKAVENSPGDYDEVADVDEYVKQLTNGSLLIKHARQQDAGTYSCRATNGVGPGLSKVVSVVVRMPVNFIYKYQNNTVRRGDMVNLQCEPNGDVPMTVTWLFNGRKLYVNSKPRFSLEEVTLSTGRPVFHVIIAQVEKHDSGFYACKVSNAYGEDESKIRLVVLEPPSPPEVLTILSHGSRSVTVSWIRPFDGNTAISRYVVQLTDTKDRKQDQAFNITVAGTESSTTVSGLQPSSNYMIQMAAENEVGLSDMSKAVTITTSEEAPAGPPLDIKAELVETNTIKVSWLPPQRHLWNGPIRGYYIGYKTDRSASDAYTFKTFETKDNENELSRLSTLIDNLQLYTKFSIIVQAFNSVGTGPKSNDIFITTSEGVPSKPPENVICNSVTSQSIRVAWDPLKNAFTNGILQGYKVLYSPLDEWYGSAFSESRVTSGHQSATISGLRKFTNYSIHVAGFTKVGDGEKSHPVHCTTKEDVPDAPADLKAMATSPASILVTWKKPVHPNGNLVKYNVYMRRPEEPNKEDIEKHAIPATQAHFEARGLRSSSRYDFWVTSVTTIGEGQSTRVVTQQTSGSEVPARIVSFGNKLVVPWNNDVELPCKVIGIPSPVTEWLFDGRRVIQNDRLHIAGNGSLMITRINGDHKGAYVCKATNNLGVEDITYVLHVQVPPRPPALVVTAVFLFSLELRWVPGEDGGSPIKKFHLYYKRDFSEWEEITLSSKLTNYTLESLECGTRYQLYITATNKHGVSNPSDTINTKTKGSPPRKPIKHSFIRESATAITLHMGTWDSGGCPILYFVVQYRTKVQSDFRLVANNLLVQDFILPDLTPATSYIIQVTAHNNAGSTVAHYDVTTKLTTGGTIVPRPAQEQEDGFPFYYDVKIVVLVTSILLMVFTVAVIVCLCCKRKRQISLDLPVPTARPVLQQGLQEFGNTPSAGSFTYLLGNSKKGLKRPNANFNHFRKDPNSEDVNPYASAPIVNNQLSEMQTFGERTSQVPQVYPALKREMRDGTFPRSRRENVVNLDHNTRTDNMCDEEYTSPVGDGDREAHPRLNCYPIYASFPRACTRSSEHMHLEHHVPDLLEHGPESSTSNDSSSDRMSSGIKSPGSLERRYISDHRSGYDTEETTFVFFYHRDSHAGDLNSQELKEIECEKLGLSNYTPEAELREKWHNQVIPNNSVRGSPAQNHPACLCSRPVDFTIAV